MKQDVGFFDTGGNCPDLVIENGDLKADNGLETAALISLFSDKRVTFEELPLNVEGKRGWWADLVAETQGDQIGSKLWLLEADGKVNNQTPIALENYLSDAFQWLIDDGIAASVSVSAERTDTNEIEGSATIRKPDGENVPFSFIWDGQELKLFEE